MDALEFRPLQAPLLLAQFSLWTRPVHCGQRHRHSTGPRNLTFHRQ